MTPKAAECFSDHFIKRTLMVFSILKLASHKGFQCTIFYIDKDKKQNG